MELTAEMVEGLVESCLKKNFDGAAPTPDLHREMWGMCCTNHKFVAIAAPRGHAKSTAITHAYSIANIVFRTKSFILIVSDTETQSTFFLNDIKKELTENEDLIKMFGIKEKLAKDAISDFIVEFDDGHQCRVIAKGSGQSLRGVKWDNKRPDLILCDDMENDELVMNKNRRTNFRRWIAGTLIPCLAKHGCIRAVGTVLHADSQLERWMPKEWDKDSDVTDLRTRGKYQKSWYSAKYRAHDSKMRVALWPQYKSIEWLRAERQAYIDQGLSDIWSQEMLNNPIDEESAPFRRGDFKEMELQDKERNHYYYIGTDFAVSSQQKSDYTCFVIGAVNEDGELSIPHVIKERMDSKEIEDTIFMLNKLYKPEHFFFEKGQIWKAIEPHILERMVKNAEYFSYKLYASITDKVSRSSSIRARMRAGAVKFDKKADWYPDFEDECLGFPRKEHDDQVDALSILGRGLNDFVNAPTAKEQEEEAREEELQNAGLYDQGRNSITGY